MLSSFEPRAIVRAKEGAGANSDVFPAARGLDGHWFSFNQSGARSVIGPRFRLSCCTLEFSIVLKFKASSHPVTVLRGTRSNSWNLITDVVFFQM